MKKNGFTLVELLVVFTILAILSISMVTAINPVALANRGQDAKMKKDLLRIRVAFEEYYSDKGCFPNNIKVIELMDKKNCNKQVFDPWLPNWICGPGEEPYKIAVDSANCPKWYKIMANLRNKKDNDIPKDWYAGVKNITGGYTNNDVNYGISSQNISWNDQ